MKFMKLWKHLIVPIIFNLLLISNLSAQNILEVMDCESNSPIAEVSIFIQTQNKLEWDFVGNTSNDGFIKLDILPSGSRLMITTLGYEIQLIELDKSITQKSICLKVVEIELTNLIVKAKQSNPFIRYQGGILTDNKGTTQRVNPFTIHAKEVTINEFAEFVKETGYITEVEKLKLNVKYQSSILFSDSRYLEKFKLFQQGNFKKNRKSNHKGFEWKMVGKISDTLTWKHDINGKLIDPENNNYPVVNITYNDALAYAKWIGGRLPLLEEYLWIHQNDKKYLGWRYNASGGTIYPVETSPSNKFGVYDIYGNVSEYIFNPNSEDSKSRIFDVGHFSSPFTDLEISEYRDSQEWLIYLNKIGFRVVRELEE